MRSESVAWDTSSARRAPFARSAELCTQLQSTLERFKECKRPIQGALVLYTWSQDRSLGLFQFTTLDLCNAACKLVLSATDIQLHCVAVYRGCCAQCERSQVSRQGICHSETYLRLLLNALEAVPGSLRHGVSVSHTYISSLVYRKAPTTLRQAASPATVDNVDAQFQDLPFEKSIHARHTSQTRPRRPETSILELRIWNTSKS